MFGELLAPQYLRWLLDGFLLTLGLALLSCLLATLIGAPLAIARLSRRRLLSWPARAYLALFPGARLGVVIPLGLFLEFVRAPAYLLIGVWAGLQVVFAYIGPSFGMVAWWAHIAGFVFGLAYGVYVRAAIARRLRKRHGF